MSNKPQKHRSVNWEPESRPTPTPSPQGPRSKQKAQIILGAPSEPIDGAWRYHTCEYSLDGGQTWHDGEVQSDGHSMAEETLTDDQGNPIK